MEARASNDNNTALDAGVPSEKARRMRRLRNFWRSSSKVAKELEATDVTRKVRDDPSIDSY